MQNSPLSQLFVYITFTISVWVNVVLLYSAEYNLESSHEQSVAVIFPTALKYSSDRKSTELLMVK